MTREMDGHTVTAMETCIVLYLEHNAVYKCTNVGFKGIGAYCDLWRKLSVCSDAVKLVETHCQQFHVISM